VGRRILLRFLDEEFEGKVMLKSILLFKYLNVLSTKITCHCLKDRNTIKKINTVITTEVMAVTRSNHSDRDNERNLTLLDRLRHRKLHCIAWSYRTSSTDALWCGFLLWLFCAGFPLNVVTKLITPHRWSVSVGCPPLGHTATAHVR
jgi:hypothetical protein